VSKLILFGLLVLFLSGCGDTKKINGITYDTYGLLSESNKKNPNIRYELILGNVIWGIILCETIAAPIYFFGFSMWEPVGLDMGVKGQIDF